jgi:DNA-directed RNA polymerase subunit RPC12/RpoP
MFIEKLKYSKCPHCGKYGVPFYRRLSFFKKHGLECKYCGKKFKLKLFHYPLAIAIVFAADIAVVGLAQRLFSIDISGPRGSLPVLLGLLVYTCFFAPIEEVDE